VTSTWYGFAAPSNVPGDVLQKIKASIDRALDDDAFRASLDKMGFTVLRPKSQAEIDQFVAADSARWAHVIKTLNISLD
jgi:tripartite-type tricarboxylate transporter receptor subunit TctC